MNSLFRSSFSARRENAIKETLMNTLSENAREIQFEFKENGKDCLELNDATNSLCTTLEAIFLHGLKDSFIWQTFNVISSDVDRRPEPSFWSPLLVFMHKQVIEQINTYTQINSEIGYCRSWVRLSLNESLFSSYINNIRKNGSALNPYYKKFAFLKDSEIMDMAAKILEGLESCIQINLPVNSSLLNQWPNYSLQLAGLWTPPIKSCQISNGVDVASSITEVVNIPTPRPLQTNEPFLESISNSPFSHTSNFAVEDLTHRENLNIFLQKVDEMEKIVEEADSQTTEAVEEIPKKSKNRKSLRVKSKETQNREPVIDQNLDEIPSHGNSLTNLMQSSWSSELTEENLTNNNGTPLAERVSFTRSNSNASSVSSLRSPIDRCSYDTLLKKHKNTIKLSVWETFYGGFQRSESNEMGTSSHQGEESAGEESSVGAFDFEIVPHSISEKFTYDELRELVDSLCKLAREPGLDVQGFLCKSCASPLGIGFSHAKVCSFSGNYFCESCMDIEQMSIPAQIIYNWNFRKYPVSKRAATFLTEFQHQSFIDLKVLNPDIYQASEQMAELQSLRIRLNFIRAYLYTCCPSSIEELQRIVAMKNYLFEHIHLYSIADLNMIQRGALANQLQKGINSGEKHILSCALCSVKGFICEICNSPKVLYPFHIDTTYRCEPCGAVFHASCLNEREPCPKCERRRKRQDLPLFEAIHNMS